MSYPSSSPFLRKPLPNMRSEAIEGGVMIGVSSSLRSRPSMQSKQSYSSLPDDVSSGAGSPMHRILRPEQNLERHLTLIDLIAVGVGGTVGSGLFVLAGLVAHQYAGPATVFSWLVSGCTACLSGCCYAELSSRIPLAGGAYAYNYVSVGELGAVVAAACLSLEYIAASAAVARSWGDKCVVWLVEDLHSGHWVHDYLDTSATFNPLALLLSATTVALLLAGVKESKAATNFFTILKLAVVFVIIFGSLYYVQPSNWEPFVPYGVGGVVRGATSTFFGYLGYDQVTALAGEAIDAKRNLPRAIIGVLIGVMTLYISSTLFLCGMQSYEDISPVSGFPNAFRSVGANWVAEFVSFGEIATLPIVILVTIMAQPRLQYAMAVDGLLPSFFKELDSKGNLWNGTLFAGVLFSLISAFVPFAHLNDMISCAVLSVLALTDSSVVLLWHEGTESYPTLPGQLMAIFHGLSLLTGVAAVNFYEDSVIGKVLTLLGSCGMVFTCCAIHWWCPKSLVFGGGRHHYHEHDLHKEDGYFRTPLVPFFPCAAVAVNWYLISQLELIGVCFLLGFLGIAVAYYFLYAAEHSVGRNGGWVSLSHHDEIELEHNVSEDDSNPVPLTCHSDDRSRGHENT